MGRISNGASYGALLREIKDRIHRAQYEALKAVNKELIALYWDIGKIVVEKQKKYGWGKSIVENLAKDLQIEFPGIRGFSAQNLWRMRQFYLAYERNEKLSPLVREIGWSHNIIILMRCKDALERELYIRMTHKFGWTKYALIHNIDNELYKKTLSSQTNFDKAVPAKVRRQAKLVVKDEYTFDFLEIAEDHNELELERALIKKINRFLVEMGGVFASSLRSSQWLLRVPLKMGSDFLIEGPHDSIPGVRPGIESWGG